MGIVEKSNNHSQWPILQRAIEEVKLDIAKPPSLIQRIANKLLASNKKNKPNRIKYANGIYILLYHSVVDPDNRQQWEYSYKKGEVTAQQFRCQLEYMLTHMTPIALSQAPELLSKGELDRPYFAVTFDDGFQNNLTVANPIIKELNLKPTVFVNGAFARQEEVFFRILSAIIIQKGHAHLLAARLRQLIGQYEWSDDGDLLFIQMKTHYTTDTMEQATIDIYKQHVGDPAELRVHLDLEELKKLQNNGWEIGNHTDAHRLLSCQNQQAAIDAIECNAEFLKQNGIYSSDFLCYPVGRAQDVNKNIEEWLTQHPDIHGIFANNGVNLKLCRKEWLRFSFGQHVNSAALDKIICSQIERTYKACLNS
ncbi:MAG: polysaccharide deacetylase family protein [Magnetococcales bacterium]|nr:polysaccharide deacetylase family protein [Magnetococcales bacterium]